MNMLLGPHENSFKALHAEIDHRDNIRRTIIIFTLYTLKITTKTTQQDETPYVPTYETVMCNCFV